MAAQPSIDFEALDRADTVLSCLNAIADLAGRHTDMHTVSGDDLAILLGVVREHLAQALDDVRGRGKPNLQLVR